MKKAFTSWAECAILRAWGAGIIVVLRRGGDKIVNTVLKQPNASGDPRFSAMGLKKAVAINPAAGWMEGAKYMPEIQLVWRYEHNVDDLNDLKDELEPQRQAQYVLPHEPTSPAFQQGKDGGCWIPHVPALRQPRPEHRAQAISTAWYTNAQRVARSFRTATARERRA
jgi:hypothetical protein